MPCGDIRDDIEIRLDTHDVVTGFALTKRTCGAPVRATTLEKVIRGHTLEAIIHRPLLEWVPHWDEIDSHTQFLLTKSYYALTRVYDVLSGKSHAGDTDHFFLETIVTDETGTIISGWLPAAGDPSAVLPCHSGTPLPSAR